MMVKENGCLWGSWCWIVLFLMEISGFLNVYYCFVSFLLLFYDWVIGDQWMVSFQCYHYVVLVLSYPVCDTIKSHKICLTARCWLNGFQYNPCWSQWCWLKPYWLRGIRWSLCWCNVLPYILLTMGSTIEELMPEFISILDVSSVSNLLQWWIETCW